MRDEAKQGLPGFFGSDDGDGAVSIIFLDIALASPFKETGLQPWRSDLNEVDSSYRVLRAIWRVVTLRRSNTGERSS